MSECLAIIPPCDTCRCPPTSTLISCILRRDKINFSEARRVNVFRTIPYLNIPRHRALTVRKISCHGMRKDFATLRILRPVRTSARVPYRQFAIRYVAKSRCCVTSATASIGMDITKPASVASESAARVLVPIPSRGVDYRKTVVLAPMVRSGELPSRLCALKYGADLVWGLYTFAVAISSQDAKAPQVPKRSTAP